MEIAVAIAVIVVVAVSVLVVFAAFVWAAIYDGRKDRAVQARLGLRRKTRLGR